MNASSTKRSKQVRGKMSNKIKANCAYDRMVLVEELKPNPDNPNQHPKEQVKLLTKIIKEQGWRAPITVSVLSGFIVRGHARLEAALALKVKKVPVDFQNYDNPAQEWADLIADNKIAELATWDEGKLSKMLNEIKTASVDLGFPDFDIELTGFTGSDLNNALNLEPDDPNSEWSGMPEFKQGNHSPYKSIAIHFKNPKDLAIFAELIKQPITEKTRYIWYPKAEIIKMDKIYKNGP